jgi:uncharacterized protein YigE (DUF2233 family)
MTRKPAFVFAVFMIISLGVYLVGYNSRDGKPSEPEENQNTSQLDEAERTEENPEPNQEGKTTSVGKQRLDWLLVRDLSKVSLFSNLDRREPSNTLQGSFDCPSIVSAGFYSKENTHIGLFMTNGEVLSNASKNALFNGFFTMSNDNVPSITNISPSDARFSVQTGPILIRNSTPLGLSIRNDEPARRLVAATTREGNIVFIVVYDERSVFSGPRLGDLPEIVFDMSNNTELDITDAINLDGGSASVFVNQRLNLRELTKIGGFFCIKQ